MFLDGKTDFPVALGLIVGNHAPDVAKLLLVVFSVGIQFGNYGHSHGGGCLRDDSRPEFCNLFSQPVNANRAESDYGTPGNIPSDGL